MIRWTARLFLIAVAGIALVLVAFTLLAGRREAHAARDRAPTAGRFVPAADVEMFVQEDGPADGPAVLFVHGTGAWSETWRESMTAVAQAGFRAVALDLPPFGFSSRPEGPRYGKREQARRIVGVLDALGIERVVLVGHSFGGGPTVEAALLVPERVRALVLVDAALGVSQTGERPLPSAILAGFLAARPLRDGVVATFLTNPYFTRRLLRSFIADPVHATPSRVEVYQRPLVVKGSTRAVGDWLPTLLAPTEASDSEIPATYRSLGMPLRLIWGALDTITPLDQGRFLVGLVPGAELVVMEGVGHIPQIEDPKGFNERLLRLLAALSSRS